MGYRLLRFSSTMINLGRGALEIRSSRPSTASPWNIDQVIFTTGGGSRRVDTTATMVYGGDGHGHWHVARMVDVDLWSSSGHATGSKIGYCFFDTTLVNRSLPGARTSPFYRESMCARRTGLTSRNGISVGWGDELATWLVRALNLPPTSNDYFTDDETSVHQANINALAEAGIATGCDTGLYCPGAAVLRGSLASFLHHAFD